MILRSDPDDYYTDYMIGLDLWTMTHLEGLPTPLNPPKSTHTPYKKIVETASGEARAFGIPEATWEYGFLTQAQREQLRAFCPGPSAEIYMRTRVLENHDEYRSYRSIMFWMPKETRDAFVRTSVSIRFKLLEQVDDPDITPPTAPGNLQITSIAQNHRSIALAWDAATDDIGVWTYEIYLNDEWRATLSQGANNFALTYTDSIIPQAGGSVYNYSVRALDRTGNSSDFSNYISALVMP